MCRADEDCPAPPFEVSLYTPFSATRADPSPGREKRRDPGRQRTTTKDVLYYEDHCRIQGLLEDGILRWDNLTFDLEREARELHGDWMQTVALRDRVKEIVTGTKFHDISPELQERLDSLLVELTAATRENVCTNTRCPHYHKKCKMR